MQEIIVDTRCHIETPENVHLTFQLAGPGLRLGAYLIDWLIIVVILFVLWMFLRFFAVIGEVSGLGAGYALGLFLILQFILVWFYSWLLEGFWSGKTIGKSIFHLRVIKRDGCPIGFFDAGLRNVLRVADWLPFFYGIGFVTMLTNRNLQRIGDLVAGTIVVFEQSENLQTPLSVKDSIPVLRRAECSGVFHVPERTLSLIETFFRRRDVLSVQHTEEIAADLAFPLAEHLGYDGLRGQQPERPGIFLLRVVKTFGPGGLHDESNGDQVRPSQADLTMAEESV